MDRQLWDAEFRRRFERHEEELRQLYLELYRGDTGAWEYCANMLYRMWQERPEALRALDAEPVLDGPMLSLALWLRQRYFCTLYDAFHVILPVELWYTVQEF